MTLYTRKGTVFADHLEFRCINRKCRTAYRYGYYKDGDEIVYTMPFENEYIISSQNTGFEVNEIIIIIK